MYRHLQNPVASGTGISCLTCRGVLVTMFVNKASGFGVRAMWSSTVLHCNCEFLRHNVIPKVRVEAIGSTIPKTTTNRWYKLSKTGWFSIALLALVSFEGTKIKQISAESIPPVF